MPAIKSSFARNDVVEIGPGIAPDRPGRAQSPVEGPSESSAWRAFLRFTCPRRVQAMPRCAPSGEGSTQYNHVDARASNGTDDVVGLSTPMKV